MNQRRRQYFAVCAAIGCSLAKVVWADNFSSVHYDSRANELVVTMRYRGTNPDHTFSLKWGECATGRHGNLQEVSVDVLDDQWQDRAERDFQKTVRFSLAELPCRPATVTLRTAPRYFYSLIIPGR
jgi:hypothetical protein